MSPRTDLVTVYLPINAYGTVVADAEVNVRPRLDQACPGNVGGITADVYIYDVHQDEHRCSDADATEILKRIKAEMASEWAEIEAKAEENHLEGATPARAA